MPDAAPKSEPFKPSRRRWPLRIVFFLALAIGLLLSPMGCTTRITPPVDPADPTAVFVLVHGRTTSLVLPSDDGGMIRYAYGDWNYYALGNSGLLDSARALVWPTSGALGRKAMPGPHDPRNAKDQVGVVTDELYELHVSHADVQSLRARLDRLHEQGRDQLVVNEENDFDFVPHPETYTYFHNSNHLVARWLRELGCDVRGPAFAARWAVE